MPIVPTLFTRRRLLVGGAAVTALPAAAGLTAWSWWTEPPSAGLRYLSEAEVRFLDALAAAAWPGGTLPGGGAVGVPAYIDELMAGFTEVQGHLLRLSMHAFEQLPRATTGRAFSALHPEEGTKFVEDWLGSPSAELRGAAVSLVLFCGMAWTSHPAVAPSLDPYFWCGYGR